MKHIFLTGEIQIGKSTVIRKALERLKGYAGFDAPLYGGFYTYFGPDRANPDRCLYLRDAASPPVFDEQHIVARFSKERAPEVLPWRFDTLGASSISEAGKKARLIVMDECGGLERDALFFQREVRHALNGGKPVLGVVKAAASGFADEIRRHPGVRLLTVSKGNRETLPLLIAESLSEYFNKYR